MAGSFGRCCFQVLSMVFISSTYNMQCLPVVLSPPPPTPSTPIQDVTLAQLHSLHLGGREGLRAPTLQAFLSAFRAADCRRPLVIEIKRLQTDAARERLLALLRWVAVCWCASCCF